MFPCEIQEQPKRHTLSVRFRSPAGELVNHFGRIYPAIMAYVQESGAQPVGAPYAAYLNMDMDDMDVIAGIPVSQPLPDKDDIQAGEIPAGTYAICHYTGPYDQVAPAYDALNQYALDNGYEPQSETAYEWYVSDPAEVPPEELKTDVSFLVKPIDSKEKA